MSARIADPYVNEGNPLFLSVVPPGTRRVLDVSCSGGENARRLHDIAPGLQVVGLTHSSQTAEITLPHLDAGEVIDLEKGLTNAAVTAWHAPCDQLLFSHVLENLDDPVAVLRRGLIRAAPVLCAAIDRAGLRRRLNLFSRHSVMLARWQEAST